MDKQLHIHILDALQQSNAIDKMVDIKPAFLDELDSQEKRKNFKAQLDYLLTEGLIEAPSKFEFLGWELLTGLYPIDNKKIEARLIGKWESYLSKRGNVKREIFNLPLPLPEPIVKLGLYDAPSTVLPYPGVNVNGKVTPPTPPEEEPVKLPFAPKDDDGFLPFTTQKADAPPAAEPNSVYLKEDDFLPFKIRSQAAKTAAKEKLPTEDPYAVKVSNYTIPETPKQHEEPKPEEPKPEPASPEQPKPDALPEFGILKTTYTPPKAEVKDVAVTVKPFTPTPLHQPWKPDEQQPAPSIRITAHAKRKTEVEEDAPFITARTAGLRAKQVQAEPEPIPEPIPEPLPVEVPAQRVVNLTSAAAAQTVRPVQPVVPVPVPAPEPVAAQSYEQRLPPPQSSNFAAVRFDTDNNPFNNLGTIDLTTDEDTKPKEPVWVKILKWTVYSITILVIIAAIVIYKRRYS